MIELAYLLGCLLLAAAGLWLYAEHQVAVHAMSSRYAWIATGVVLALALGIVAVVLCPALAIG